MKKGLMLITAMMFIASFALADGFGLSGSLDWRMNLMNSELAKDKLDELFVGDGNDAYNINLSYGGAVNDGMTSYSFSLSSGDDDKEDGLKNFDAVIGFSLTHKPDDVIEVGLGADMMFLDPDYTYVDDGETKKAYPIIKESADNDGVYLKMKSDMFDVTLYPMRAPLNVGGAFEAQDDNKLRGNFASGVGVDVRPTDGVTLSAVVNNRTLIDKDDKDYNAIGYKLGLGLSQDQFTADVEMVGNTQKDDDDDAAIAANGDVSKTSMATSIRGTFKATDDLSLSGEYFMNQNNKAYAGNDEQGSAMKVAADYNLGEIVDWYTSIVASASFTQYNEYLISDDESVAKDGGYNKIVLGLSGKWLGLSMGPELEMKSADEEIFGGEDGEKTEKTMTKLGINASYSF